MWLQPSSLWSGHVPKMPEQGPWLHPSTHSSLTAFYWAMEGPQECHQGQQDLAAGTGLTTKGIRAAEGKDSHGASGETAPPLQPALQAAADPAGQEHGQEKQHQQPKAEAARQEQYCQPSAGSIDRWLHVFKLMCSLTSFANSR